MQHSVKAATKKKRGILNPVQGRQLSNWERITLRVIQQMEKGIIPWRRPWKILLDGTTEMPTNYVTKKRYQGVNAMILACAEHERPYYLTWNQVKQLGGSVKKGAHSEMVLFYLFDLVDETGEEKKIYFEQVSHVFNIADVIGIEFDLPPIGKPLQIEKGATIQSCETVVNNYKTSPPILYNNPERAFYAPSKDVVNMPRLEAFTSSENYYFTLFHELVHSTAHPNRLDRKEAIGNRRSSQRYHLEELVAEIGASLLSDYCGLNLREDSPLLKNTTSYLTGYLETFRQDRKVFFHAARQAQKAVNYILGEKVSFAETDVD